VTMQEKIDLLDGLFAYDGGCLSSGIKDDLAKAAIKKDPELLDLLTGLAKRYLAHDVYTIEDIKILIDWASEELNFKIGG